jgi:acyl-CoA reductase-like NAD-dependent aldehyde dehydrogenase
VPDAMAKLAAGLFYNAGQSCNAPNRLLVQDSIADAALEALERVSVQYSPENPFKHGTQVGAIVSGKQLSRIITMVDRAVAEGASCTVGGHQLHEQSGGFYYAPTVIDGALPVAEIAQEEVFGPVLTVHRFSDEASAVVLANGTKYGLWANVFTNDLARARRLGRSLQAGTVGYNMTFGGDITTPFGGFKESGVGRDRSLHALNKYTHTKHLALGPY